jgi:hypothetical protein
MLEPYFFVVFHEIEECIVCQGLLRLHHDIAVAAKIKTCIGDDLFVDLGELKKLVNLREIGRFNSCHSCSR